MKLPKLKLLMIPLLFFMALFILKDCFIINSSKSEPIGIYFIDKNSNFERYDYVLFKNNVSKAAALAVERRYMKPNAMYIKNVYGIPGDHVQVNDSDCLINNQKIGKVFTIDSKNRPLPAFRYNDKIPEDTFFVTSTKIDNSYDSRYIGLIHRNNIIARLIPFITF